MENLNELDVTNLKPAEAITIEGGYTVVDAFHDAWNPINKLISKWFE
jgi:hypothetical protein